MTGIHFRGRWLPTRRASLRPYEAAYVLQMSEATVGRLVEVGVLEDISHDRWRRLDPEAVGAELVARIERGAVSPLGGLLFERLLRGEIECPRTSNPSALPPALALPFSASMPRSTRIGAPLRSGAED